MKRKAKKTIFFIQAFQGFHTYFADLAIKLKHENKCNIGCITFGADAFEKAQTISEEYINIDSYEEKYNFFRTNIQKKKYISKRINEIENTYGPLWIIAHSDRQYVNYHHSEIYGDYSLKKNEIISLIIHWFDYFEEIFSKNQYTHVISYATGGVPALVAAKVIKKLNGHYIGLTNVGIPDRFSLTVGFNHDKLAINVNPQEKHLKWSQDYYAKYQKGNYIPSWINKNIQKSAKQNTYYKIINFFKQPQREKKLFKFINFSDPGYLTKSTHIRIKVIFSKIFSKLNLKIFHQYLFHQKITKNKYIFYPIPVEPESGRLIRAPYLINQIAFIENLSKAIPANYSLLVKDHPNMDNKRKLDFYKKIVSIPNVILIKSDIKISSILKNASAVVVINGTTGIEALLNKKPVMIFSDTLYDKLPGIVRFKEDFNNLNNQLKELIKLDPPNNQDLIKHIAKLKASSVDLTAEIFFKNFPSNEIVNKLYDLILMLDNDYKIIN